MNKQRAPKTQQKAAALSQLAQPKLQQNQVMVDQRESTVQLQRLQAMMQPIQQQSKPNKTGLPNQLKTGMESLSGMSLDHVKVHYNSSKPAAVQAHAYAQGSNIHLASGQEKHLPHELGHVVQQAQGRVKPTTSVAGMAVNDIPALENEATEMGKRALQMATD